MDWSVIAWMSAVLVAFTVSFILTRNKQRVAKAPVRVKRDLSHHPRV